MAERCPRICLVLTGGAVFERGLIAPSRGRYDAAFRREPMMTTLRLEDDDATRWLDARSSMSRQRIAAAALRVRDQFISDPTYRPTLGSFFHWPESALAEYETKRQLATLGKIFRVANGLHDELDAVVVLARGGWSHAARALLRACCDPHHNELSRADRGGKPRMMFLDHPLDGESLAGLLRRLQMGGYGDAPAERRFAVLAIDDIEQPSEPDEVALRCCLNIFADHTPPRLLAVAKRGCWLHRFATEQGGDLFELPESTTAIGGVLSTAALVPAALLGLDCMKLLEGAAAMNSHFRSAPAGDNFVLRWAALLHGFHHEHGKSLRVTELWSDALAGWADWHRDVIDRSTVSLRHDGWTMTRYGIAEPTPRRDLDQGRLGQLIIERVVVDSARTDPINGLAGQPLCDILATTLNTAREHARRADCPLVEIHLPNLDTYVLGQLLQACLLANVIEAGLGSPGSDSESLSV